MTPSPTSSRRCAATTTDAARDAANLIASRSPIAVSVALEAVRRAAQACRRWKTSWARSTGCPAPRARSHDLVEGIRAQIVDKDRNPKWSPPSLAAVTEQDVEDYFAPADPDLTFEEDK